MTVTSALPYIHGVPHLGNIVGSILPADIYHRYLDIRGQQNVFICGSDVHGTPSELEAIERGMDVEELKEEQHEKIKGVLEGFNCDFSIYSETHSEYNREQTYDMFEELYCGGYITEKEQRLPYCINDDRFLPDRYIEGECPHCGGLARGDQCDDCGELLEPEEIEQKECQICGETDVEMRYTTHLFLDLPQFKTELLNWLENSDEPPIPERRIEEVKNAIKDTEPRCITRDIEWGFDLPVERVNERIEEENLDVPELDPDVYGDKVFYVWFDAPIGYIGFTRELFDDSEDWKKHWNQEAEIYYSLGKDNTIFHTVIWPSMLIGASNEEINYGLPQYEFIQNWLLAEDTKFSKSRGKGLSTEDALEMYPEDYWRFYLARKLPQGHDTTFAWDDFEETINNVLNDTVGNFVNRTLSLAEKWFDNEVPVADLSNKDQEIIDEAEGIVKEYTESFESHNLKEGLDHALELARLGDRYLSEEEPWNNPERREPTIQVSIRIIRALAATLYPFTPETSQRIAEMLDTDIHAEEGYNELIDPLLGGVEAGHELGEREILFEKIDTSEQQEQLEKEQEEQEKEEAKQQFNQDTVSFEEFQDMDMRVGEVVEVEEHPNADRLYKVQVSLGEATLQTCAGLREHYTAEELEGKRVIVLANLEPTELRGEKSECMMLVAENENEELSMLTTEEEIEKGSKVE